MKLAVEGLEVWFGPHQILRGIDLDIPDRAVTVLTGPSGCGKSTLLRALNRMHELVPGARTRGRVLLDGQEIRRMRAEEVRARVGMVFQRPNPFPGSIFRNVAFGPSLFGVRGPELERIVTVSLRRAHLWPEVQHRLSADARDLSGGQQQRLCIARALAVDPEVILMDEPASALDPISTAKVEDLMHELKSDYSIVLVTHNMQQSARVADYTAFFLSGDLIEFDQTDKIFSNPRDQRTEDYITGRFG